MSNTTAPALTVPISDRDHSRGPADAPVTLVEYGDYECPHCGRAFPILEKIREEFPEQVRFIYRHFPLMKMHPHAKLAAEAAESAGAMGKFWEMHEMLHRNQSALEPVNLFEYAEQVGLDLDQFQKDLAEHTYEERVNEDFAGGIRSGVNGTPTIFINGQRQKGYDRATLTAAVRSIIG